MGDIITKDYYKRGSWNAICDLSGQKAKIEDMRMQWNGLLVLKSWWSPKQPQQDLRPRPDHPARSPVRNVEPQVAPVTPFTNSDFL